MNIEWIDGTTYSRDEKKKIPSVWKFIINGLIIISVHKHIHYPKDQWLLTCLPFFNKYELPQTDVEEAKSAAFHMVYTKLQKINKIMSQFVS